MINYQSSEMHRVITDRLINEIPTSIVRYGDGEAIILNGFKDPEKLKSVLKRQLGYVPEMDKIEMIRENLIEAYKSADFIGIPTNPKALSQENSYWARALGILNAHIGTEALLSKQLTSLDFHSYMLDNGQFDRLLYGLDELYYISCRRLNTEFWEAGVNKVNSYIIPPEIKFTDNYQGVRHLDVFHDVIKWVGQQNCEGKLCLVGAGFTGKIYTQAFKECGGVAVDIGCVFDMWAGLVTRGPERGVNIFSDKYKLSKK